MSDDSQSHIVGVGATDQRDCMCRYLWKACRYKALSGCSGDTDRKLPPTASRSTEMSLRAYYQVQR